MDELDPLPFAVDGNDSVRTLLQRLDPDKFPRPGDKAHLLRLWSTPGLADGASVRATLIEFFLDDTLCRDVVAPDLPILHKNESGVRYAVQQRGTGRQGTLRVPGEAHPGQFLSALAEAGVAADTVVKVGGEVCHVTDLVEDAAASVRMTDEIEWQAVAVLLYRPYPTSWRARDGGVLSWAGVARELVRRTTSAGVEGMACGGTHVLYALAVMDRVDARHPILSDADRARVHAALEGAVSRLLRTQRADGSWDDGWDLPGAPGWADGASGMRRLLITGHHLEWLAIAARHLGHDSGPMMNRACGFVRSVVGGLVDADIADNICPCSHGMRGLLLLERAGRRTTQGGD